MMDALVVYRSSHSPFRRLHDSALAFGFRRSSVTASASMASLSASVAVTPRSTVAMASSSASFASRRAAALSTGWS
jgi:hypothetical protein